MPVFGQVAGSSFPSGSTLTWEPWHCQQPLTSAAETPFAAWLIRVADAVLAAR